MHVKFMKVPQTWMWISQQLSILNASYGVHDMKMINRIVIYVLFTLLVYLLVVIVR